MPANFTIQVRYRPNHTRKVHFTGGNGPNPGDVEVTENTTITFVKMPGSHDFAFASFSTSPGSDDFEKIVTNNQITVTDNDADPGTYEYTVCVYPAGDPSKPPVCSDPQIINKPE